MVDCAEPQIVVVLRADSTPTPRSRSHISKRSIWLGVVSFDVLTFSLFCFILFYFILPIEHLL